MGHWSIDTIISSVKSLTDTDVITGSKLPNGGGGTSSEVDIVPSSDQQLPSDAKANQPPVLNVIKKLCQNYNKNNKQKCNDWIAGHLTNASWGGSGSDTANMTVLSVSGNNSHKSKFEQKVKNIQYLLYNYYREIQKLHLVGSQQDLQDLVITVTAKTQVSAQKHGSTYPFNYLTKNLLCSATLSDPSSTELLKSLSDLQHNKNTSVNEKPALDAFFRVSDAVKKLRRVTIENSINLQTKNLIKMSKTSVSLHHKTTTKTSFKKTKKK